MKLRADRPILSLIALAAALAASGAADAQPYSRPSPHELRLREAQHPQGPQAYGPQNYQAQLQDDDDGRTDEQAPDDGDAPDDSSDWNDADQQPDGSRRQPAPRQFAPDRSAPEQHLEDDESQDQGAGTRRPPAEEPDPRDDNDVDRQPEASDPRQPGSQDRRQPGTQDQRQDDRRQDDLHDDTPEPDDQEVRAPHPAHPRQIITLYDEPAPLATPLPPSQAQPSSQSQSRPEPAPQQRAAPAPTQDGSPDTTASISRAPDAAPPGAGPFLGATPRPVDAMRPADAMRPVAAGPVGGTASGFPHLPPPPEVDPGALKTDAVMVLARALLEKPATFAGSRLDAAQQASLRAFYAQRTAPVWIVGGQWKPGARAAQRKLEHAWEEGLEPADYPAPDLSSGSQGFPVDSPETLAEAEVRQSINAVKYARDASGGRLDLPRLSRLITPTLDLPVAADVLAKLATASAMDSSTEVANLLGAYNPKHPGYVALREKLITLRAARPPEPLTSRAPARIPEGPVLRVGMSDPRVSLVRSRLGLTPSDDVLYDERLATAVAEFQRQRGLRPSGVLTRQTVVAMAGDATPAVQDDSAIIVNMERWRWLPRDLGPDYIFVNIPEYRMRVVRDGALTHEARVVVGKAETATPIFSDKMQYAVINPYWNVPPSIMRKEFIPGLARDPNYAAKRGYEVIRRGNTVHVRQPPGERNALGHIKFMFPNDHAVYLHDTPSRALFNRDRRAFSHGCVRVDDPMRFAELVLGPQWPQSRIKKLIGRGERTVRLPAPLPIHLAYFTVSVDSAGKVHAREDIYGFDRRMRAALAQSDNRPQASVRK